MQKVIIIILVAATFGLGAALVIKSQQAQKAQQRAIAAEQTLLAERQARESQEAQLREAEASRRRLDEQVRQFTKVTTTLRDKEAKQSSNITALAQALQTGKGGAGSGTNGGMFGKDMGNMLQSMMKDPAMRDMMKAQQKTMITQMYGGLFKELNLPPEVREKLSAVLAESQMRNIDAAQGLFGNDAGTDQANDIQKKTEDSKQQTDAEVRAILGDEGFAKYQDYQKTMAERMQIDQLQKNLEAANLPLQDTQSAQLLQIMQEEKAASPPVIPTDNSQVPKNMKDLMTQEKIDEQLKWLEDYNNRVMARAGGVLTPEQLKRYQEFQQQQAAMQKFGLKMAREMFGGSGADQKQ